MLKGHSADRASTLTAYVVNCGYDSCLGHDILQLSIRLNMISFMTMGKVCQSRHLDMLAILLHRDDSSIPG